MNRKLSIQRDGATIFIIEMSAKKVKVWSPGHRKVVRRIRLNQFVYNDQLFDMSEFYAQTK